MPFPSLTVQILCHAEEVSTALLDQAKRAVVGDGPGTPAFDAAIRRTARGHAERRGITDDTLAASWYGRVWLAAHIAALVTAAAHCPADRRLRRVTRTFTTRLFDAAAPSWELAEIRRIAEATAQRHSRTGRDWQTTRIIFEAGENTGVEQLYALRDLLTLAVEDAHPDSAWAAAVLAATGPAVSCRASSTAMTAHRRTVVLLPLAVANAPGLQAAAAHRRVADPVAEAAASANPASIRQPQQRMRR